MKRTEQMIALLLSIIMTLSLLPPQAFAADLDNTDGAVYTFSGGDGSKGNPYLISSKEDMVQLSSEVASGNQFAGKYFQLMADIDLSGSEWVPIGNKTTRFDGIFDGSNHVIAGMTITSKSDYVGLFGIISGSVSGIIIDGANVNGGGCSAAVAGKTWGTGGTANSGAVSNCIVRDSSIKGNNFVGAIAGESKGDITNCTVENCIIEGKEKTGGISGCMTYKDGGGWGYNTCVFENCIVRDSEIIGTKNVGGITGYKPDYSTSSGSYRPVITKCLTLESKISGEEAVAGILGGIYHFYTGDYILVSECANWSTVTASTYVGGIVGRADRCAFGNGYTIIRNCFNMGEIFASSSGGGICGATYKTIENCHNLGIVHGSSYSCKSICGDDSYSSWGDDRLTMTNCFYLSKLNSDYNATPLDSEKYLDTTSFTDWDFDTIWIMNGAVGGPTLRWMLPLLPTAYCKIAVFDSETTAPISNVQVTLGSTDNIVASTNDDGEIIVWGAGAQFSANTPLSFIKDGYRYFECYLQDLSASFDQNLCVINSIYLAKYGKEDVEATEAFVNNHIVYINSGSLAGQQECGFYTNVWKGGEDWEPLFDIYKGIDYLTDVVSFNIVGLVTELAFDMTPYDAFLSDLAITMADNISKEQFELTAIKTADKFYSKLNSALKSYFQQDSFKKELIKYSFEDPYKAQLEIETALLDQFRDPGTQVGNQKFLEAVLKDIFTQHPEFISTVYSSLETADALVQWVNAGQDIYECFIDANNAYIAAVSFREIAADMDSFIDEVIDEVRKIPPEEATNFNPYRLADRLQESYDKLKRDSQVDTQETFKKYLVMGATELLTNTLYDELLKKPLKLRTYQAIIGAFGVTDDIISIGTQVNALATIFTASFSLLDMLTKTSSKCDRYYYLKEISQFERALSTVVSNKAQRVLAMQDYESVDLFETAFKYLSATNQHLYDECYIYNSTSWNKNKEEAMDTMAFWKNYWLRSQCHYNSITNRYKYTRIQCPVDVFIYNPQGELLVSIVDEKLQKEDPSITVLIANGIKSLMYPADIDYQISIVARESGQMEYYVAEVDTVTPSRYVEFYHLPLEPNQVYTGNIPKDFGVENTEYALKTDQTTIHCDYDSMNETDCKTNGHAFGAWEIEMSASCSEKGIQSHTCASCGKLERDIIPMLDHSWGEWSIVKEASEEENGEKSHTCSLCGTTELVMIPALGHRHELTHYEAISASCTETGTMEYWQCSGCGKFFSDVNAEQELSEIDLTIPALGHQFENGTCTVCGQHDQLIPTPPVPPVYPVVPVTPPAQPAQPTQPGTPAQPGVTAPSYTDVAPGSWYYDAVAYVSGKGLMTGTGANTFAPDAVTSRAMMWTILARMSGAAVDGGEPWYVLAQTWAVANGVSDGTDPDGRITREQLVTMLYRYAGEPAVADGELAGLSAYADSADISEYAQKAMAWAVSNGIINGIDGRLVPQGPSTRAQVAAILMRYCENILNK